MFKYLWIAILVIFTISFILYGVVTFRNSLKKYGKETAIYMWSKDHSRYVLTLQITVFILIFIIFITSLNEYIKSIMF